MRLELLHHPLCDDVLEDSWKIVLKEIGQVGNSWARWGRQLGGYSRHLPERTLRIYHIQDLKQELEQQTT